MSRALSCPMARLCPESSFGSFVAMICRSCPYRTRRRIFRCFRGRSHTSAGKPAKLRRGTQLAGQLVLEGIVPALFDHGFDPGSGRI